MGTLQDRETWVAAFDGGKALIWRNEAFDDQPNLQLLKQFEQDTPPASELATDRPGRFADVGEGKSAAEQTDFHGQAKAQFIEGVIDHLNQAAAKGAFERLLILAPASALGDARAHYSADLKARLVERERDVVHQPTDRIEPHVTEALTAPA